MIQEKKIHKLITYLSVWEDVVLLERFSKDPDY